MLNFILESSILVIAGFCAFVVFTLMSTIYAVDEIAKYRRIRKFNKKKKEEEERRKIIKL